MPAVKDRCQYDWIVREPIDGDDLPVMLIQNELEIMSASVLLHACRQDTKIDCWSSAFVAEDAQTETEVSPYSSTAVT